MENQEWIVAPSPTIALQIVGTNRMFAIRRIYCVVRNYDDHIRELGNARPDAPIFFTKQRDEIVTSGSVLPYPSATSDFQHEIEMVAAIGRGGTNISVEEANDHILGYAVGLDMTRRDMQTQMKEKKMPWGLSKSFDGAAPCGAITLAREAGHPARASIRLLVNEKVRQDGDISHLIWNVPTLISELSHKVRLEPGDLVYTGTPAGVGPVMPGDHLRAEISGLAPLDIKIGARAT